MLQPGVSRACFLSVSRRLRCAPSPSADVAGRRPTCGVNAQPRETGPARKGTVGQVAAQAGHEVVDHEPQTSR